MAVIAVQTLALGIRAPLLRRAVAAADVVGHPAVPDRTSGQLRPDSRSSYFRWPCCCAQRCCFSTPGRPPISGMGRFATYFMDPLTLAQHIAIAGFICLFCVDASARDPGWLRLLKYAGVVGGHRSFAGHPFAHGLDDGAHPGGASGSSASSATTARSQISLVLVAIVLGCVATYWVSGIVQVRVNTAVQEIVSYFSGGNRDTSLGIRISLYRINWTLFLQSPIYGWGFRETAKAGVHPRDRRAGHAAGRTVLRPQRRS